MDNETFAKSISTAAEGLYGDIFSAETRKLQIAVLSVAAVGVLVGSGFIRITELSGAGLKMSLGPQGLPSLFLAILLIYLVVVYLLAVSREWQVSRFRHLLPELELLSVMEALKRELALRIRRTGELSAAFDELMAKRKELSAERDKYRSDLDKYQEYRDRLDELCQTDGLDQIQYDIDTQARQQDISLRMSTVLSILEGRNTIDRFRLVLDIFVPLVLSGVSVSSLLAVV